MSECTEIKGIYYGFGEEAAGYTVGRDGVTRIIPERKNGEMSVIVYYEIYKGDKLFAEMHIFSEIIYA